MSNETLTCHMTNEMRDDLISRKALLAEYDRVHIGEPGKARKLIEDAPTVDAIILPCKMGETVYVIRKCSCYHMPIRGRRKCSEKVLIDDGSSGRKTKCGYITEAKFELKHIAVFGKDVFLTKQEAESALAKMDGGNEDGS